MGKMPKEKESKRKGRRKKTKEPIRYVFPDALKINAMQTDERSLCKPGLLISK